MKHGHCMFREERLWQMKETRTAGAGDLATWHTGRAKLSSSGLINYSPNATEVGQAREGEKKKK